MTEQLWTLNSRRGFDGLLASGFAIIALALTVIGVYSVVAYSTMQNMRELAVRVAFGARPSDVFRLVVRQTLKMVMAGLALGLLGYAAISRLLAGMIYGIGQLAWLEAAAALLLVAVVSLAASVVPARRVARIDPAVVLHEPPRW